MESSISSILKLVFFLFIGLLRSSSSSSLVQPFSSISLAEYYNHTAKSEFRAVNRRKLHCLTNEKYYLQTGDTSDLPLLCHYPVKAQYVSKDPGYLNCKKKVCQKYVLGVCVVHTCSGSITFHVVNIRTDIEFVFFTGGFDTPCILTRSKPLNFSNPKMPLHGHLSSIDSSGTSMRLTWVSGDNAPQQVQYGNVLSKTSVVSTFTQADMCSSSALPSPAKDFGWHDPGYIHTAVMTGLNPSSTFSYKYGSNLVGWSDQIQFKTPPAGGSSSELHFIAYGDMGKVPLDPSVEHYIQPGSLLSVIKAVTDEVNAGNVSSIFHIGDISYATGFLVEWDFFLDLIQPAASKVSYITAIGNRERDYVDSGSVYITADSGGECGVAYETYFQMPTSAKDKPWYSIEKASVHFTIISTEHDWSIGSEQVDLVLFVHVHNYERTCAVYQGVCEAMPTKDAKGVDTYNNTKYSAPVQAIIGMLALAWTASQLLWSLVRISEFGYIRVNATKAVLDFEFVDANTRNVEDHFRITK
ncbi:putative inactive purple acid phosphatase 24 [Morella rubra]|uniref:Putative inactive purple acid phosphatase 24 n=1 Tax=Morella rubra TaxID=262757 RepID=A0A6A1VKP7_9ROSI|nr:putative inactive purple acid phosphatase 24 [Morella rubra]